MEIKITRTRRSFEKPLEAEKAGTLGFGNYFTDHMFLMDYSEDDGWHNARIEPYHDLALDPASTVLHYGQEIFEGMKAYRAKNDDILFFRPRVNAERWNESAERVCMPKMDPDMYCEALNAIVSLDRDWVPHAPGTSLVLRPAMIAIDKNLGVHPAKNYLFFIICSPSGAYFKNGMAPVSIYVEEEMIRAAPGGTGYAKCGGNYAGSMLASERVEEKGYDQVLWLDGIEHKYIAEVGSMNIMFVIDDTIVTAPLDGTILPGVTRDSILTLAKEAGWKTEERKLSIDEVYEAAHEGRLNEAFGTGTAAVVAPVGKLCYKGEEIIINGGETGPKADYLYDRLLNIQLGNYEDKYGWVTKVK
jgi:branched-chain amino acid aminotransferase